MIIPAGRDDVSSQDVYSVYENTSVADLLSLLSTDNLIKLYSTKPFAPSFDHMSCKACMEQLVTTYTVLQAVHRPA